MPWSGEPKGKLFPVVNGQPFVLAIECSNYMFFMLFSTEEKLKDTTLKMMMTKLGLTGEVGYDEIKDENFVDEMMNLKIRMMCDPVVIDDHHTKWTEIVRQGDVYKYVSESN